MTVKIEKFEVDANQHPKDKLKFILLAFHVNRDSLSRSVDQETLLEIDCTLYHLMSNMYSKLERLINKDEDSAIKLQESIDEILKEIECLEKFIIKKMREE